MFVNVTATEKIYTQEDNRDEPQCIGGKYPPILMEYMIIFTLVRQL